MSSVIQPCTMGGTKMKKTAEDRKWEAEDDLRTLARAEEIKMSPERMKACKAMAKQKIAEMAAATK